MVSMLVYKIIFKPHNKTEEKKKQNKTKKAKLKTPH